MIDENKMIREIEELRSAIQPASLEDRLLTGFLTYIKGQKPIDVKEYYFRLRMAKTAVLVSEMGALQSEDFT